MLTRWLQTQRIAEHKMNKRAKKDPSRDATTSQVSSRFRSAESTVSQGAPHRIRQASAGMPGDRTLPKLTGNHLAALGNVTNR